MADLRRELGGQRHTVARTLTRTRTAAARAALLATLADLDADAFVRSAGLADADLSAIRTRLLSPSGASSVPD